MPKCRQESAVLLLAIITYMVMAAAALVSVGAAGAMSSDTTRDLELRVDSITFLSEALDVLLVSNEGGRLVHYDIDSGKTLAELPFDKHFGRVAFTDVALSQGSPLVYLVGEEGAETRSGILVRVNIKSFSADVIRFSEPFLSPSIAVDARGRVFIGDLNANTITVVEDFYFEKFERARARRSKFPRNIYLKGGAAVDLGTSLDGRFILVSHVDDTSISLVDNEVAAAVDEFGPGVKQPYPLPIVVVDAFSAAGGGRVMTVVTAEVEGDVLAIADIDREFQSFGNSNFAPIGFHKYESNDRKSVKSPLLLAASPDLETIIVGSRNHTVAGLFLRIQGGLERRSLVRLLDHPRDIDVSLDGQVVAILGADGRSVRVIRNVIDWFDQANILVSSDRIREAQRLLSALQFPVGAVDGFAGRMTDSAVSAFQESANLRPTGVVDVETLAKIREVASEMPSSAEEDPVGTTKSSFVCRPIDLETLCASRLTPSDTSKSYRDTIKIYRATAKISADPAIEEISCASASRDASPVQIDRYSLQKKSSKYQCTSFHSCPYIRFRDVVAYDKICRRPPS